MGITLVTPNHTQFTDLVRAFFCDRDWAMSFDLVLAVFFSVWIQSWCWKLFLLLP